MTTGIQWTDETWNPTVGCSKISEGCQNCYAIGQAYRNTAMGQKFANPGRLAYYEGLTEKKGDRAEWTGTVNFVPEALEIPLKWKKPRRIFVNSMSDLFHGGIEDHELDQIFAVMALTPQHTYQVLTKRPDRMAEYCNNFTIEDLSIVKGENKLKLAVLDKDGTLTQPISGARFPQNPQDQGLMPGVRGAIDRLRADGWSLAIASNQGGCDWFEVSAITLRVGQRFQIMDSDEGENFFSGDIFTAESIGASGPYLCIETTTQDFDFGKDDRILVQYKTIESAIEEIQYAADLCGIDTAMFCPDMAGKRCLDMMKTLDPIFGHPETADRIWKVGEITCDGILIENYRKPGSGMLTWANISTQLGNWTDRIMIGDRPEDEAAALAAGFRFLDAQEWRNGASMEVVG